MAVAPDLQDVYFAAKGFGELDGRKVKVALVRADTAAPVYYQGTLIANLIVNFTRQAQIPEGSALAILIAAFVTDLLIIFRKSLRVEDVVTRG